MRVLRTVLMSLRLDVDAAGGVIAGWSTSLPPGIILSWTNATAARIVA